MDKGKIFHVCHGDLHIIRLVGVIRYLLAPALKHLLHGLISNTSNPIIAIDLSEARMIDSTNLGLLAWTANEVGERHGQRITVFSGHDDTHELLLSLGFDEVFDIVTTQARPVFEPTRRYELTESECNTVRLSDAILESHRALMRLNEHNREMFQEVVTNMERDAP